MGRNGLQQEVVLMALAASLVTGDAEGIHWLVCDPATDELPQVIVCTKRRPFALAIGMNCRVFLLRKTCPVKSDRIS